MDSQVEYCVMLDSIVKYAGIHRSKSAVTENSLAQHILLKDSLEDDIFTIFASIWSTLYVHFEQLLIALVRTV